MSNVALSTLTHKLATTLNMGDSTGLIDTLKATAFKGQVSDSQMVALLVVANQYGLNPWTKEIYAFPDKNNGIVPVVGVDGWSRIINTHQQFDGLEFEQDEEKCTCIIYRKDRTRPVKVTEYMSECKKSGFGPWQTHPMRMLRHKAMIQCARIAFGYGGIYDQDEAENFTATDTFSGSVIDGKTGEILENAPKKLPELPSERFENQVAKWKAAISEGKRSANEIHAMIASQYSLTEEQSERILGLGAEVAAEQSE